MVRCTKRLGLTLACAVLILMADAARDLNGSEEKETLRYYADKAGFLVGNVIQGRFWNRDPLFKPTLSREFNLGISIVFMRWTQPERGRFEFSSMDDDIRFAKEHNMKLLGDCLVYRPDTAATWLHLQQGNCGGWSAGELDRILKDYIQTVVRHGADAYLVWEVVDEPTAPGYNGCWSRVLGRDEYIAKAFRYAHEANPNALLLLNDTFGQGGIDRGRAKEFFSLVRRLKSNGVPIDVVGTEMHLELRQLRPTYIEEFKDFLQQAREAGVQVYVTEMDVYQGGTDLSDPFAKQKEVYYNVVHTCLQDSDCKAFIPFGINDHYTWLVTHKGLTDAKPLLFDENYGKKPAYYGVLEALKEGR